MVNVALFFLIVILSELFVVGDSVTNIDFKVKPCSHSHKINLFAKFSKHGLLYEYDHKVRRLQMMPVTRASERNFTAGVRRPTLGPLILLSPCRNLYSLFV